MKTYQFSGQFDESTLFLALITHYPSWIIRNGIKFSVPVSINCLDGILTLIVPDDADDQVILQIIDLHDPTYHIPITPDQVLSAKREFLSLPEWSTWTSTEATTAIQERILTGQTKEQVNSWVDSNVTNIATAKTGLKLLAGAIIDIRVIVILMAKLIILLRDVVIRNRVIEGV
jgi:hypothetical protein